MGVVERGLRASELLADGDEHSLVPETGHCHPGPETLEGRLTQGRGFPPRSYLPHYAL